MPALEPTVLDVAALLTQRLTGSPALLTRPRLHRLAYLTLGAHYVLHRTRGFADTPVAFPAGPGFWALEGSCTLDPITQAVVAVAGGDARDVPPPLVDSAAAALAYFAILTQADLDAYTTQPGSPWDLTIHTAQCTTTNPPIDPAIVEVWFAGHLNTPVPPPLAHPATR